ncbi:hypothetical protein LINPERPRIM_LOCUS27634 [Linum perenne]
MGEYETAESQPQSGLLPNGLLPDEAASMMQVLDSARWSKAEERTAELIECIKPNEPSENQRKAVASYVQQLIAKCFPCQVFTFGSVPLKTYLPDGDIDLTAFSKNQTLKESWAHQVRDMLENEEKNENAEFHVKEVQYIQAEVKIIKCLVENIVVDISFNQLGGLCTLCFLEEVDHKIGNDHLFKRSIILIKAWCYYESRILGAHHGLISTYALETLVLYIFHVFNNSFAGPLEVLYRFLEFFSKFDWDNFCVSLWGPVPISSLPNVTAEAPRKDDGDLLLDKSFLDACGLVYAVFPNGQEHNGPPFTSKHFNVIDPLRVNNNLGRSVSKGNFFRIRSAFAFGAKKLASMQFPQGLSPSQLNHYFTSLGLTSSPEGSVEHSNEHSGTLELNRADADNDFWNEHERASIADLELDNGSFEMDQSDDKQQSTSGSYHFVHSSRIGGSGSSSRVQPKSSRESHSSRGDHVESYPHGENRSAELLDERLTGSPTMSSNSLRSRAGSESSWDGLSVKTKSAREKRGRKAPSDVTSVVYATGKAIHENASIQADDDTQLSSSPEIVERGFGPPATGPLHVSRRPMPGLELAQTSESDSLSPIAPVILSHGARFYPTGPPVPFVTMLPIYKFPTERGTSDASTSQFSSEENNEPCQNGDLREVHDHSDLPSPSNSMRVASVQAVPNRPTAVYQPYVDEVPRYRGGTGTYLPNPQKVAVRDRHSPNSRKSNYNYDRNDYHHGDREGNWNNSKSRGHGRSQSRNQADKLATSESRSDRTWVSHRHDTPLTYQSQNGPTRPNASQVGSANMAYGMYPITSGGLQSNGQVVMLYPYNQNTAGYVSSADQIEFGSLGPVGHSGVNDLNEGSRSGAGFEEQRFHSSAVQLSSPDQPSSPHFRGS